MSTNAGVHDKAPLYARALRLRHVRPGGFGCFLLFEAMIATAVLLALAELVSWWSVPVLPAAVAVMVKVNDFVVGVTRPATSGTRTRSRAGTSARVAGGDLSTGVGAMGSADAASRSSVPAARRESSLGSRGDVPSRQSLERLDRAALAERMVSGGRHAEAERAARHAAAEQAARHAEAEQAARHAAEQAGRAARHAEAEQAARHAESRSDAGTTYRSRATDESRSRRRTDDEEPRRPVGTIRISLPPRDGGAGRGRNRSQTPSQPPSQPSSKDGDGRHTRHTFEEDARPRGAGLNQGRFA